MQCHREAPQRSHPYAAWDILGNNVPDIPDQEVLSRLPSEAVPVAGFSSHHLLAGEMIDTWFRELQGRRGVRRFFILSPRHWDLGTGEFSLTLEDWETEDSTVRTDRQVVKVLADTLGAEIDAEVFAQEHGVSTFMPFISRYFPRASVVALVYRGEPPVNTRTAAALWSALEPYFTDGEDMENFLLISADFSHHSNLQGTLDKDRRTMRFMEDPGSATWIFAGCDNRPGAFIMGKIADGMEHPAMCILYHSNSFYITQKGEDDITSYFFTFLF